MMYRDDHPGRSGRGQAVWKAGRRSCQKYLWLAVLVSFFIPLYWLLQFKGESSGSGNRKFASRFPDPEALPYYPVPQLHNLVLVAGHSVFVGTDFNKADDQASWYLESYQQVDGEVQSFEEHIKLGVEAAARDPHALLLFSGGATRTAAGPRTEGLSYWEVADANGWFNHTEVRGRAFIEDHARDSFENLLFSMCRFYELTGHYPSVVTVVSYSIKQARFTDLHRRALKFPKKRFHFIGTAVPLGTQHAEMGEYKTVEAYRSNMYGCTGPLLKKRRDRDPFAMGPPDSKRCPAIQGLMHWCSPTQVFPGDVPW